MENQPKPKTELGVVNEETIESLRKLSNLAQRQARGEKVETEITELTNELSSVVTQEVIDEAIAQGIKNEYGDMDQARFEPTTWDRIKRGEQVE